MDNRWIEESTDPILTCRESGEWESEILSDEAKVWAAMQQVGQQLGRSIRSDYSMTRYRQRGLNVLALVGKGHNGGDALLALCELAKDEGFLETATVVLSGVQSDLKPLTKRAYECLGELVELETYAPSGKLEESWVEGLSPQLRSQRFDLCIDGLLGMQFSPPLRDGLRKLLRTVNAHPDIGYRAAVDLPSGMGEKRDEDAFVPDATYATGICKTPLLGGKAGAIRYLDIGFFEKSARGRRRVVKDRALADLRGFRSAEGDKRKYGHLVVLAGSRHMPGALAMCVKAALRSGVGLVTVCAPESIVSQLACTLPEAMWRTWPETPEGGLALEGVWQIKALQDRATGLLMGPGMGSEPETLAMMAEIGSFWEKAAVLDADALRKDIADTFVNSKNEKVVLTPHDGEFLRLSEAASASDDELMRYVKESRLCVVKKGSATRIAKGDTLLVNPSGNGVLSRGGSGDLLAGLLGGLLAQEKPPLQAAAQAVYWHGKAADIWAMAKGQVAVHTTELLDFLPQALQAGSPWNLPSLVSKPTSH